MMQRQSDSGYDCINWNNVFDGCHLSSKRLLEIVRKHDTAVIFARFVFLGFFILKFDFDVIVLIGSFMVVVSY